VTYTLSGMQKPDEEFCADAVVRGGVYMQDGEWLKWTPASVKAKPDYCVHGTSVRSGDQSV